MIRQPRDTSPPVYAVLAEELRGMVREGGFRPGQLLGHEHELARRQGVSRVTVRRASEILVAAGILERRPGKGLYVCGPNPKTGPVHVVTANLHWYPPEQMVQGVQAVAAEHDIPLGLYDACNNVDSMVHDIALLRHLPAGRCSGAILTALPGPSFNRVFAELAAKDFPVVLVAHRFYEIPVSSVISDDYSGGYEVGKLLVGLGHRRIGFIGSLARRLGRDRLDGMRDAVADAGLVYDRSLEVALNVEDNPIGNWSECAERAAHELLGRSSRPTAVFCSCDAVAGWVAGTARLLGLRIPQDLSLVGFGGDPLTEALSPVLTTVREPYRDMGRLAMQVLCRRIEDCYSPVEHHALPVELVVRGSTARPPETDTRDNT